MFFHITGRQKSATAIEPQLIWKPT